MIWKKKNSLIFFSPNPSQLSPLSLVWLTCSASPDTPAPPSLSSPWLLSPHVLFSQEQSPLAWQEPASPLALNFSSQVILTWQGGSFSSQYQGFDQLAFFLGSLCSP